jgi:hypothetical protein
MNIPIKNRDLYAALPRAAYSLKEEEIIFSTSKKKKHEPETHTGTLGSRLGNQNKRRKPKAMARS